jgi:uncharacterized protein YbjT (DUF2867 family)
MSETPRHALVVGGTGMLRGVVLHLALQGWTVSVVARRPEGLDRLRADTAGMPGHVHPIALDYADDDALRHALADAIARHGPLTLAAVWIRPGAPHALDTVATAADCSGAEAAPQRCRFFRILGSAAADPALERKGRGGRYRAMEGLAYREIVLGFRIEGEHSRWNSNDEIAEGVIAAIEGDLEESVIGVVRPWEMNPRLRGA